MYSEYFGFREKPFNITPDPRFFYANSFYEEAYANLFYGIRERKGFIVLTGEVGTGKTTLLRRLIDSLEDSTKFVLFYNTTLSFEELLDFSFSELGLEVPQGGRLKKIQMLNQFLISELAQGAIVTLLIDEAQNLKDDVLENLRLLSNLETAQEKLLQIVLVGQPELDVKLAQPHLRQLKQRITTRCHLSRLRDAEIESFISHRLRTIGYDGPDLFSREALQRLAVYCQGIPRLINVVCDNALLIAYGASQKSVNALMIDEAARDLQLLPATPRQIWNTNTQPEVSTNVPPSQGVPNAPACTPQLQTTVQGPTAGFPESPLKTTPKERQIAHSSSFKRYLVWVSVLVLIFFGGVTAYDKYILESGRQVTTQEESTYQHYVYRVAQTAKFLNERLSSLLTPRLPITAGQTPSNKTSKVGSTQEVAPSTTPPEIADQALSLTRLADAAIAQSSTEIEPNSWKESPDQQIVIPFTVASSQEHYEEEQKPLSLQRKEPFSLGITHSITIDTLHKQSSRLLQPGETISTAVLNVYGNYNSLALDLIKEWNPHIKDLDKVAVNQKVWFPPLTFETLLRAQEDGTYHLIVATFRNLLPAEQFAQTLRKRGHSIQVTSRQVSQSILLYRVEITGLPSRVEAQQAWHVVTPTNVFFVTPRTTKGVDLTKTIPPENEAMDFPETGL